MIISRVTARRSSSTPLHRKRATSAPMRATTASTSAITSARSVPFLSPCESRGFSMVILEQPTEPLTPTDASYDNRGCTSRKGCPHPSACRGRASPKLVLRSVRHELHLSIGSDASSARVGEAPSGRPCLSVGCSGRLVPRAGSRTVRVLRTIERRAQRAFLGV